MSNNLGKTTDAAVPVATRTHRSGWRDPRLWIGILIVTASVVGGARLLATVDDTVAVWAAADQLGAGAELHRADLVVTHVRFAQGADLERYYRADRELPGSLVLIRGVGAGELLPRAAVGPRDQAHLLHVPLEVEPHRVPPAVDVGSVVDVYLRDDSGGAKGLAGPALQAVTVVAAPPVTDTFAVTGTRQLVVAVSEADAVAFQKRYAALDAASVTVLQHP